MFESLWPKRFLRLSTALLAMATYCCMLPPIYRSTGGARKIIHNNTLSGGPCIRFNTVLFSYLFCITYYVLCNPIGVILLLMNEMMMVKIAIHNMNIYNKLILEY